MARDRYRYFRVEAQELCQALAEGLLELERAASTELVKRLLRLAHTLKGAARVVHEQAIAERAHQMEDLLAPLRDAGGAAEGEVMVALLGALDAIRAGVAGLAAPPGVVAPTAPAPAGEAAGSVAATDSVRVPLHELAVLQAAARSAWRESGALAADRARVEAAGAVLRALHTRLGERAGPLDAAARRRLADAAGAALADLATGERALAAHSDTLARELRELADAVAALQRFPAEVLFADLQRAARDAAQACGREVEFQATGGEHRLAAPVVEALRGALAHVVRNAVAHGIEPPAARATAGKPRAGRVRCTVEVRGHRAVVRCTDDGAGIDEARVRGLLVERGRCRPDDAAALPREAVLAALLQGGVSTSVAVGPVAGRGVGLDAVRAALQALGGECRLESVAGAGTAVELRVPLATSVRPVLAVSHAGRVACVPLHAVRRAVAVTAGTLASAGATLTLTTTEGTVPCVPLAAALGAAGVAPPPRVAVLVAVGDRVVALGVERLEGVEHAVVEPLPREARAHPVVAGAVLDAAGACRPLLAPEPLFGLAAAGAELPAPAPARAPILVIDDSLTTRMLEQSILESAGYEVDLAVTAEEALVKAAGRRYGLFVVDVEMPGMDGFEFIARCRGDAALRDIPAILVTSRADPADRQRGTAVGAAGYLVKSEFDQRALLANIRELLG
jgi:two-component system chemotaxis sensor kinase CheA